MSKIWAVAVNTVRQSLRLKIAAVFIVLLLILLPVMGFKVTGDGTLKGRLQTFISYGLSLTTLLLCLLTIVGSIYTLTSDIKQMQIFTVLTKPIRRFQLMLGKFLGIVLLDILLLGLFASIIYAIVVNMPRFIKADLSEVEDANNVFFTARAGLMPQDVDVSKDVESAYEKLKKSGEIGDLEQSPIAVRNFKNELARRIQLGKRAVAVGQELLWEFNNVKITEPNQRLFIKFKYDVSVNPADQQVYSNWIVGDDRQLKLGTGVKTPIYQLERKDLIRTAREIEIPADCVADDGYLAVGFFNPTLNDTVVIFPPEDGLEVLYKADSFTANFFRGVLLILIRLVFLAALGVLAGSFLSFPVALLLSLSVFFTAYISGFILESFEYVGKSVSAIYDVGFKTLLQLLPQFDKFSTSSFLVPGRLLSWSLLARVALSTVCLKAVLLLILALLIFRYREIAKVTL
jgi:hypothetical protein